ncbi:MAG: hypothetical protein AAGF77_09390 [Bacteroidota bacterium]
MKKYFFGLLAPFFMMTCGLDNKNTVDTYTYRINNETGTLALIAVVDIIQEVPDGGFFECTYDETFNFGLCQDSLSIIFTELNNGYSCSGAVMNRNGKCFVEDSNVFMPSDGENGIFEETRSRFYEYTLTPELLERAFELPLND